MKDCAGAWLPICAFSLLFALLLGTFDIQAEFANYGPMNDLTGQEMDAKLAANKAEIDARLANFDASLRIGFAELRTDFATMRADTARQINDSIFKIVGAVVAVVSIGVAIIGLMINWNRGERFPAPAAPVIITIPPAPQAPAAAATPPATPGK